MNKSISFYLCVVVHFAIYNPLGHVAKCTFIYCILCIHLLVLWTCACESPFYWNCSSMRHKSTRLHVLAGLLRSNVLFSISHIIFVLLAHHNKIITFPKRNKMKKCGENSSLLFISMWCHFAAIRRFNVNWQKNSTMEFGLDNGQLLLLLRLL